MPASVNEASSEPDESTRLYEPAWKEVPLLMYVLTESEPGVSQMPPSAMIVPPVTLSVPSRSTEPAATIAANAVVYPGEGGAGGIAVYGCVFLGKDAFAMVDVAGGSMEMIIKSKEEAGGPLNQFGTIGVYFETGGGVLYEDRLLRVECGGFYSDVDEGT